MKKCQRCSGERSIIRENHNHFRLQICYFYGRFRDNNLLILQTEFRSQIYRRFGYAIFGGISEVSSSLSGFTVNNVKPNYGVGLRFLIDRKEKINLRLDYGIGIDGQSGFYISFGESF